ncbi:PREDICTED: uncharacterized protein LOC100631814 [Amphimedon queenslandica]|uniref:CCHC-type domain-containing protein n=1 Tax=Amphimedon queenslandica TaxID=400682 RepID=A0A1X7VNA4_AMPQE|nr:PREDICTED: uncharacterized protein LOC100631814 [Amphimedon queenslandica]|eukprot:XP_003383631.1 PREDICTED: uncharacterized protein LOC100631814 [Amphimedon queenslandica]
MAARAERKTKKKSKRREEPNDCRCFLCGEIGHYKINCPNEGTKLGLEEKAAKFTTQSTHFDKKSSCFHCGRVGHYKANCPLLAKKTEEEHHATSTKHDDKLNTGIKPIGTHQSASSETPPDTNQLVPPTGDILTLSSHAAVSSAQQKETEMELLTNQTINDESKMKETLSSVSQDLMLNQESEVTGEQFSSSTDKCIEVEEDSILGDENLLGSFDDDIFINKEKEREEDGGKVEDQVKEKPVWQKNKTRHKDISLYQRVAKLPRYLDTHCHVEYLLERHRLSSYADMSLKFCYPSNFDGCITSFCDPAAFSSFGCYRELLEEDKIWASFGMHPRHARSFSPLLEERLLECLAHPKCIALGEIGLDFSGHSLKQSNKAEQKKLVNHLLQYAQVYSKPLILHCRDAEEDLYEILCNALPRDWFIHLHCYTGSVEMALKFVDKFPNLYIGLTGHVTQFKFKDARSIARDFSLDRLLIETDSPYMMPFSMRPGRSLRGLKWTHPPMAVCVAEEIGRLRDCITEEVLTVTRRNAQTLYGI